MEQFLDFSVPNVIRLRGHRIGLEHIVERYQAGYSVKDVAREFTGLELEIVTYYLTHRVEVECYVVDLQAQAERDYQAWAKNPPPPVPRLQQLKQQMLA